MKIKFSLTLRHCVLNVFKYELTRMHFNVLDPDVASGGSQEWTIIYRYNLSRLI